MQTFGDFGGFPPKNPCILWVKWYSMTPLKQRLVNRPPNLVAVFRILTLLTPEIWWRFFEEQVDLHPSRSGRSDDSYGGMMKPRKNTCFTVLGVFIRDHFRAWKRDLQFEWFFKVTNGRSLTVSHLGWHVDEVSFWPPQKIRHSLA